MANRHTESDIAIDLVAWWEGHNPAHRTALIHIPNGAVLGGGLVLRARRGARLKKEGLRPGASDYFLALPRGGFAGLFLELKAIGKKPTADQLKFLAERAADGYCAQWAAGLDDAKKVIETYMGK